MILATADPAKFPDTVFRAIGQPPALREDWQETGQEEEQSVGVDATVRLGPEPDSLRELLRDT